MVNIQYKSSVGKITLTKVTGGVIMSEETTDVPVKEGAYTQPTCNVGVSASCTKNMGDFNSIRVGVSLNMPCYAEEIDATYTFINDWVNSKMEETISLIED